MEAVLLSLWHVISDFLVGITAVTVFFILMYFIGMISMMWCGVDKDDDAFTLIVWGWATTFALSMMFLLSSIAGYHILRMF